MALQGLDDKSQVLTASVFWYFTWKDEIFRWDNNTEYKNISRLTVKVSDVWVPEIYIVNDVRDMPIRSSGYNKDYVIVRSNGYMTWFPAKELQTSCAIDITKYPFDTQTCKIRMETWYHDNTSFVLNTIGSGIGLSEIHFVENGEWDILNLSAYPFEYQEDFADNSSAYSCIHYTLILKRRPSYHLITTAFPFVILMAINLLVIVIPTECGEKLGFCMSQFLTMIVFLTLIAQNMPSSSLTISYLTFLISLQILVSGTTILIVATSIYLQTRSIEDRPSFVVGIIFSPLRYFKQNYFKKSFTLAQDSRHEGFITWLDIDRKLNCGLNILLLLNVIATVSVFVFVIN
ncbi:neuronal acetylcholine receptor subunit alpha-6-like [Mytilus trossulus]|uniref:neuronal acetylcholine receptor subunit alpha-6-like n=1 Tax=Mytilus trossulus TaxID=6551 RepID=UPI003003FCC9